MPSVYEDPAAHGLALVGVLQENRIHEDVFCHNWRIAVWHDLEGDHLLYRTESNSGARFAAPPFEGVDSPYQLRRLTTPDHYDLFKHELNDYWWCMRIPASHLRPYERTMRNRRNRLQRKVGRFIFAESRWMHWV